MTIGSMFTFSRGLMQMEASGHTRCGCLFQLLEVVRRRLRRGGDNHWDLFFGSFKRAHKDR